MSFEQRSVFDDDDATDTANESGALTRGGRSKRQPKRAFQGSSSISSYERDNIFDLPMPAPLVSYQQQQPVAPVTQPTLRKARLNRPAMLKIPPFFDRKPKKGGKKADDAMFKKPSNKVSDFQILTPFFKPPVEMSSQFRSLGPSRSSIEYGGFKPMLKPSAQISSRRHALGGDEPERRMNAAKSSNEMIKFDFNLLKPYKTKTEKATVVTALRKRMLESLESELPEGGGGGDKESIIESSKSLRKCQSVPTPLIILQAKFPKCQGFAESCHGIDSRDSKKLGAYGFCLVENYPQTRELPLTTNRAEKKLRGGSASSSSKKEKSPYTFDSDDECTEFVHLFFRDCKEYIPSCNSVQKDPRSALPVMGCLFSQYPELMIPLIGTD